MVDLNQFLSVGGMGVLLVIVLQFLKGTALGADAWKPWLPWVSLVVGVVLMELFALVLGRIATPADWVSYGLGGVMAGWTATGQYESTLDKLKGAFTAPK